MKRDLKNKILVAVVAATLVWAPACEKVNYGDINTDPNRAAEPTTSALLTNVLSNLGTTIFDETRGVHTDASLYCQYFSETQYTDDSRYSRTPNNWDGYYANQLYDLQNIIIHNSDPATAAKAAVNGSNADQIGIARILKAYYYWWITDTWGDLPYTEALKAVGAVPYDKQENVYPDLLKELKEAVASFDNGIPVKGDVLFNGDISSWKRLGNSLRMLIALRMSKVNPGLGQSEYASALADPAGSIESNDQNATLVYPGGNFLNVFYNYYNVTIRDDYAVCETILNWLNSHGDNRNQKFGTSTVGFPYGLTSLDAAAFGSAHGDFARLIHESAAGPTSPVVIIGAAHVLLARAEAANLGWSSEDIPTLYNSAIDASWNEWGVYDAAAIGDYKAHADVDIGSGNIAEKIATQQWVSWYPNGTQGWSVWRKTGYPALSPAPGQPNPIPRRFAYGVNEPQLNPANYAVAAAGYVGSDGDDSQWGRMWWDKP
jgi:Starch-binding associating with outer membrane